MKPIKSESFKEFVLEKSKEKSEDNSETSESGSNPEDSESTDEDGASGSGSDSQDNNSDEPVTKGDEHDNNDKENEPDNEGTETASEDDSDGDSDEGDMDSRDSGDRGSSDGSDSSNSRVHENDNGSSEENNNEQSDSGTQPENSETDQDSERDDEDLQRAIEELNNSDESMDIMTDITEMVNSHGTYNQPYMVSPNVRDIVGYGPETTPDIAKGILNRGLEILGPKGSQLTRLFVAQSHNRIAYNQYKGNIDIVSLVSDVHDVRNDLYKNINGPKLDKAAVSFLIDNSSSMIQRAPHIYSILSATLHYMAKANIPTEAIGYTVESCKSDLWRDATAHMTIIKDFKESYQGKVMRRCRPPLFYGLTNDLDGMKLAIPRLWARPEKKKVLLILCDGKPYIGNYTLTSKLTDSYKEYIKICRKAGITVFGIGIDVNLSGIFGEDYASVTLTNAGDILMDKLGKILNKVGV